MVCVDEARRSGALKCACTAYDDTQTVPAAVRTSFRAFCLASERFELAVTKLISMLSSLTLTRGKCELIGLPVGEWLSYVLPCIDLFDFFECPVAIVLPVR